MSSNLGSSSKRKREKRSVPEPVELRRSARQKAKNNLSVIQSAMDIKKANNSLESGSSNSTQNHSRANDQTNVVQPTPAANDQHINQSGSHNFNSDDGWTTVGHIHNVNEERAPRLNPLAPEFHFDLSNNKPMQSYIQSSRSQQPIMTEASRRTDHSGMAGLRRSIDQAAQPVQFVPRTASLNSQMMPYDTSQRVIQPVMPYTFNHINEAPQPRSSAPINLNVQASPYHRISSQHGVLLDASRRLIPSQGAGFHRFINQAARPVQFSPSFAALNSQMMSSDASQRVNHLIVAEPCNLSNEAPWPSSNMAINQNMPAVPYHQILSSQHGSSQRVGHPIVADSCNLNEAHQPSSNNPTDSNMQTPLLYQMFSSQHGVPQHIRSSSYPIVDPTPNAIAVNQRYPIIGANSSQRNNYPVLDFVNTGNRQCHRNFPRLDNFAMSNSEMNDSLSGRRSFTSILNSEYDAQTQLQLEAEFQRSMVLQDQPQSTTGPNNLMTTNSLDSLQWQNNAKRVKNPHKEAKCSVPPVITDRIKMEGGNPLSQSPPQVKPLGERCRLCKIDLAFNARGADPQSSSDLPFAAVLPCKHAFHDQCLKDLFGDIEPPCVECLDVKLPHGS